jgi:hypothetical protein
VPKGGQQNPELLECARRPAASLPQSSSARPSAHWDAQWRAELEATAHPDQGEAALAEAEARIRAIEAERALIACNIGIFVGTLVALVLGLLLAQ